MSVKQFIKQSIEYYRYIQAKRSHIHTIDDIRKGCQIKPLSAEQKREIKQFYKENFGVDVNLKWHEYYSSVNGIYSPEYIPTYLYYTKICPKMNVPKQMAMYSDKNMIDKVIPSAKIPTTYVKNINGYFYIDKIYGSVKFPSADMNIDSPKFKTQEFYSCYERNYQKRRCT